LAIISKHMSTGGPAYDGRKCAEARELVRTARVSYQAELGGKTEFFDNQLAGITKQQAEKDFLIAEFYRKTGHPGAAYFYYEIVRRRYPNTPLFDKATERMNELRTKLEREQNRHSFLPDWLTGRAAAKVEMEQKAPLGPQPHEEQAPPPRQLPGIPPPLPGQPEVAPPPQSLPGLPPASRPQEQAPPPNLLPAPPGQPAPAPVPQQGMMQPRPQPQPGFNFSPGD
jgi:hypothetical protein